MKITREDLNRLELIGDNVLIKLPWDAGEKNQETKLGITLSFIYSDKEKYAPVYGTIVKHYEGAQVKEGDQVFFHYLCWNNSLHTAESWFNGHYDGTKTALICETEKYLLMSEAELFFAKRGDGYVCMNDYLLLKGIPKKTRKETVTDSTTGQSWNVYVSDSTAGNTILTPELKESHRTDIAEVIIAPEDMELPKGAIVYCEKDWDVPLEYDVLETLGETIYRVHRDVVLGVMV